MKATITAAIIAASIPAAGHANSACELAGSIAYAASEMRLAGLSQRQSAGLLGDIIGAAASDLPGDRYTRQVAASIVGAAATDILQLVYSVSRPDPDLAAMFVWEWCMEGGL